MLSFRTQDVAKVVMREHTGIMNQLKSENLLVIFGLICQQVEIGENRCGSKHPRRVDMFGHNLKEMHTYR